MAWAAIATDVCDYTRHIMDKWTYLLCVRYTTTPTKHPNNKLMMLRDSRRGTCVVQNDIWNICAQIFDVSSRI